MLFTEKRLVTPYLEIAGNITTFLNILFVELSKFSSGLSDFFPLPNTWSFCRLTGTSRVKSFSSCQTFFRSFGCYFQIIWELVRVSLLFWIPSLIFGFFMCLNCLRTFFTVMKTSNSCLFDNFCLRWVCMRSLFLLANQRFYQFHVFFEETILGCPEPCLLSIEPVYLSFFNICWTEEKSNFLDGRFFQIL